jgi:NAD(P)-dependent dehydrogenase (short-subunit alcohol dehydrogenase family)
MPLPLPGREAPPRFPRRMMTGRQARTASRQLRAVYNRSHPGSDDDSVSPRNTELLSATASLDRVSSLSTESADFGSFPLPPPSPVASDPLVNQRWLPPSTFLAKSRRPSPVSAASTDCPPAVAASAADGDGFDGVIMKAVSWVISALLGLLYKVLQALRFGWRLLMVLPPMRAWLEVWYGVRGAVAYFSFVVDTVFHPSTDMQRRRGSIFAQSYEIARAQLVDGPSPAVARSVAIVTGGNRGVGKELALRLALSGMAAVIACRDPMEGEAAARELNRKVLEARATGVVRFIALDLGDSGSIINFADTAVREQWSISIVVCNAAIMAKNYAATKDGYEAQMGINVIGHALLVYRLEKCFENVRRERLRRYFATLVPGDDTAAVDRHVDECVKLAREEAGRFMNPEEATAPDGSGLPPRLNRLNDSALTADIADVAARQLKHRPMSLRYLVQRYVQTHITKEVPDEGMYPKEVRIIFTSSIAAVGVMPEANDFARAEKAGVSQTAQARHAVENPGILAGVFSPYELTYDRIDANRYREPDGFYNKYQAYRKSKAAAAMYAYQLQSYFEDRVLPVTVFSYHPGCVATEILKRSDIPFKHGMDALFRMSGLAISVEEAATFALQICLSRDMSRRNLYTMRAQTQFFNMGDEFDQARYFKLTADMVQPVADSAKAAADAAADVAARSGHDDDDNENDDLIDTSVYAPVPAPYRRPQRRAAETHDSLVQTVGAKAAEAFVGVTRQAEADGVYDQASALVWDWTQRCIAAIMAEEHRNKASAAAAARHTPPAAC